METFLIQVRQPDTGRALTMRVSGVDEEAALELFRAMCESVDLPLASAPIARRLNWLETMWYRMTRQ